MNLSSQEIVDQVNELISLPQVYLEVRTLLYDEASTIDDFSNVVSQDPALTVKILKIANSAFFGFASKIDNLTRAISIMGTSQLHDLVLASSAIDNFNTISLGETDTKSFWKKSVYSGVIAQLIGNYCNSLDSERYFIIGLLHNIGHLVLCAQLPKEMQQACKESQEKNRPLFQIERQMFGFDYAEVGSKLFKNWKLPESFIEPTLYHLDPIRAHQFPLETSILHIANVVSIDHQNNDLDKDLVVSKYAMQNTHLNNENLNKLIDSSEKHFNESFDLFLA